MRRRAGVSLVEAMLAMALFGLLSLALAQAVREASKIWRRSTGETTARLSLRQTQRKITSDLSAGSIAQIGIAGGPVQLASGGRNGDAVWCLSAVDPASGNFQRKLNGSPFFQNNVLYYLAVPAQHAQLYGMTCPGFRDANGYDQGCPHKVLIRKVVDFGAATVAGDESSEETLMTASDVAAYLTQPAGLSVTSMQSEAGVRGVSLAAASLISLRAVKGTLTGAQSVDLDASALSLLDAQRTLRVGAVDLTDTDFTTHLRFTATAGLP
ncbi:hypothetical protein ABS71_07665 [bacterium SCN 62-11]|nr:MAG: hypothetical protein ABS71_07665 [bacterium SCN 62-11]